MTERYLHQSVCDLYNVTRQDYYNWCKQHNKPFTNKDVVSDFFYKLRTERLVKDEITGKLLVKRPRRK